MTSIAAVILAHRDPDHVRRLIRAFEHVPVVLHCDSKAPTDVAGAMVQDAPSNVLALPRTSAQLSSWSLVRVELVALRAALARSSATHIAVLSGADYPLVSMHELHDTLSAWGRRSYVMNVPIPFDNWSHPRKADGGRWRTAHRFLTRGDDLITIRGVPARLPWKRPLPAGLELRASSQWKIYSRDDVQRLVRVVDTRPDIVRFWRSTLTPDESFAASVLSSPAITGEAPLPFCYDVPWYQYWPGPGAHHPAWLDTSHFDQLSARRYAPAASPTDLERPQTDKPQALFGRKFSTQVSSALLDKIDAELRC